MDTSILHNYTENIQQRIQKIPAEFWQNSNPSDTIKKTSTREWTGADLQQCRCMKPHAPRKGIFCFFPTENFEKQKSIKNCCCLTQHPHTLSSNFWIRSCSVVLLVCLICDQMCTFIQVYIPLWVYIVQMQRKSFPESIKRSSLN